MKRGVYHDIPSNVHTLDARAVARMLGGQVVGANCITIPGPGHSAGDRSLQITFDAGAPDGFLVHSFAGDDWQTCKDYVRELLGLQWQPGRRTESPPTVSARADDAELERKAWALEIWKEALEPRRTRAEEYLTARSLVLEDDIAGTVLRFHKGCPWRNDTGGTIFVPALIAAFRSIDDDTVTGIHRIRLDQPERWPKAERKMLGVVRRAAIKFDPVGPTLYVAEGAETAMAARQLGFRPAWAAGSAPGIERLPVIDGVDLLRLLQERCPVNTEAVRLCGDRWCQAGRRVQKGLPDDPLAKDHNDQIMRKARS